MYKQLEYLREGDTFARNDTYREDLPKSGMLSALLFKISGAQTTPYSLTGGNWRLQDYLTTLEIVGNGSTVIKSLPFKDAQFLQMRASKVTPPANWRNYATNTQFEYLMLYFGRYLWDPAYGLDLGRWDNVEVRLTNTATSTYYGADFSISILQHWLRDVPGGFQGYLRSELWRQWTTVQDETKYLILPTEYPMSLVALRALPDVTSGAADTGFANLMDDIDFSMGGGTKRIYKGGLDDLALSKHIEMGSEVLTSGLADVNADVGINVGIGRIFGWAGISGSKDGAVSAVIPTMTADETDGTIRFEAREADSPIEFMTRGYSFQNTTPLWDAPNLDPGEMLDPKRDGEIRLNIHTANSAAAASGTNEVVLERLVG